MPSAGLLYFFSRSISHCELRIEEAVRSNENDKGWINLVSVLEHEIYYFGVEEEC